MHSSDRFYSQIATSPENPDNRCLVKGGRKLSSLPPERRKSDDFGEIVQDMAVWGNYTHSPGRALAGRPEYADLFMLFQEKFPCRLLQQEFP